MAKKIKEHPSPHITLATIIRTGIFLVVVALIINYISALPHQDKNVLSAISDPTIATDEPSSMNLPIQIPDLSPYIPSYVKTKAEELQHSSAIIFIQQQITNASVYTKDFPQKQIKDLQKEALKQLYESSLKTIENK